MIRCPSCHASFHRPMYADDCIRGRRMHPHPFPLPPNWGIVDPQVSLVRTARLVPRDFTASSRPKKVLSVQLIKYNSRCFVLLCLGMLFENVGVLIIYLHHAYGVCDPFDKYFSTCPPFDAAPSRIIQWNFSQRVSFLQSVSSKIVSGKRSALSDYQSCWTICL